MRNRSCPFVWRRKTCSERCLRWSHSSTTYYDALRSDRQVLPIPEHWSFVHAAAIPEIFVTANEMLMEMGACTSLNDCAR